MNASLQCKLPQAIYARTSDNSNKILGPFELELSRVYCTTICLDLELFYVMWAPTNHKFSKYFLYWWLTNKNFRIIIFLCFLVNSDQPNSSLYKDTVFISLHLRNVANNCLSFIFLPNYLFTQGFLAFLYLVKGTSRKTLEVIVRNFSTNASHTKLGLFSG